MPDRSYIPEPSIFLVGCQAWPPRDLHGDGRCPVCHHGIRPGDDDTSCGWCDRGSPDREAWIARERRAEEIGLAAETAAEAAEREAVEALDRECKVELTEAERRYIWHGCRSAPMGDARGALVNRAKTGRDWLAAIGQLPDWSLILGRKGEVLGRHAPQLLTNTLDAIVRDEDEDVDEDAA